MSRDLEHLHPTVRALCEKHLNLCKAVGIDLLVTQTWRSREEQEALYAQGRTKPGRIVTNARGGQSDHEHTRMAEGGPIPSSLAYDVAYVTKRSEHGGVLEVAYEKVPWQAIGHIAVDLCGLRWGGLWSKPDRPHFYLPESEL